MKRLACCLLLIASPCLRAQIRVEETEQKITLSTPQLDAAINKKGYVTGIAGGSLIDKQTGFGDAGFGLDIVDWIMQPGSDEAYRDQLPKEMVYQFRSE